MTGPLADALPAFAAWRHAGARDGFEVVFLGSEPAGHRLEGCTTAVEDGQAWTVEYAIDVDARWVTRSARIRGRSAAGRRERHVKHDGSGAWRIDGAPAPALRGCLDVDLEASALTNALPVQRMALGAGEAADAPAVYVRALDLTVERLEQHYLRRPDEGGRAQYDYAAPRFGYTGRLVYDAAGLVLTYPGLAERVA